jgi:cyanophycinase-like exopeptidase
LIKKITATTRRTQCRRRVVAVNKKTMRILFAFCLHFIWHLTLAQTYTSWITGDTADATPTGYLPGLVLAGGGGDNDPAMTWMLERAAGGDVVVIRASGSDGYNNYFFNQLGVSVNSVETIRFDSGAAAYDPYVQQRIQEAEVLFIAGGDQYVYFEYWKDTPIGQIIQDLLTEKQITVGGTSAGMAILGQAYYAPSQLGVLSNEALGDPFHEYMDVLGWKDFLEAPFMAHTVTDTHFDQRDRAGRTTTFLARLTHDHGFRAKGIAANEYTAVCIDENGIGRVFGEYPQYPDDLVYFLQVNCHAPIEPETCTPGEPLHWVRNEEAVKVYVVPATESGAHTFDLKDWTTATGGAWENWWVENGDLVKSTGAEPADCAGWTSVGDAGYGMRDARFEVFPNPFQDEIFVKVPDITSPVKWQLFSATGTLLRSGQTGPSAHFSIPAAGIPPGIYILNLQSAVISARFRILKSSPSN